MRWRGVLAVLLCIIPQLVGFGQEPPEAVLRAAEAIVAIEVAGRGSLSGKLQIARASGVIIERGAYILTCGHLFWYGEDPDDRLTLISLVITRWREEGVQQLRLRDLEECHPNPVVDTTLDLALCQLKRQPRGPKLKLGEAALFKVVWLVGYEAPPQLTTIRGIVRIVREQKFWIEVDKLPGPGMSGSAVLSEDGVLVGIVIATAGERYVVAAPATAAPGLHKLMECPAGG